jgi:predicted ATPase
MLSNPQYFSLSIYQTTTMFSFLAKLFEENRWSSASGLADSSTIAREYLARGMHNNFQKSFNQVNSRLNDDIRYHVLTYESSKGYAEVERILQQMSKVSRSKEKSQNQKKSNLVNHISSAFFLSCLFVRIWKIFDDGASEY